VIPEILDASQNGLYITQIGNDPMETPSVANALFSNVRQRVLALIFGHPDRSFYTSEIVREVRSGTGAVTRELSRLERAGLFLTSASEIKNTIERTVALLFLRNCKAWFAKQWL